MLALAVRYIKPGHLKYYIYVNNNIVLLTIVYFDGCWFFDCTVYFIVGTY